MFRTNFGSTSTTCTFKWQRIVSLAIITVKKMQKHARKTLISWNYFRIKSIYRLFGVEIFSKEIEIELRADHNLIFRTI